MKRTFHYMSMINYALFSKKVLTQLEAYGLTPGQPKVLEYLSEHDGSIQKEIAFGCQIEPATLSGILKCMEKKNMVERRVENNNFRSSYVYLTQVGKEKVTQVKEIFSQVEKEVFEGISPSEREEFMNVYYKICCNMTDMEKLG